jgi:putative sigma-54 modulation protein
MNINLTGRHLEITPAIREHVTSKLAKIKRHFDNLIDINVILSVDKLKQKAEATVHMSGKTVFADVAIDNLVDLLDRQVLKHKDKNSARRHDDTGAQVTAE